MADEARAHLRQLVKALDEARHSGCFCPPRGGVILHAPPTQALSEASRAEGGQTTTQRHVHLDRQQASRMLATPLEQRGARQRQLAVCQTPLAFCA